MPAQNNIVTAQSFASDAHMAVREFHAQVSRPDMALVVFFCSSDYDLQVLADEINALFPGVLVVGCTTAGEIGPAGYRKHSISGASFPAGDCTAVAGYIDHLQAFSAEAGQSVVAGLLKRLDLLLGSGVSGNRCAMQLIDGLSHREESVTYAFQPVLGGIPLFGGSAADDQKFVQTWVFCDGKFHTDSVVLVIIDTVYPLTIFKVQHFVGGQERLVVTAVDAENRIITELNGLPAVQEYARVIGVRPEALNAGVFSASPVVVRINGVDYVRSIKNANADGSLSLFCSIENGLILRVAQGVDYLGNLQRTFDDIHAKLGKPQLVIACDCILRNMEMKKNGLTADAEEIFRHNNVTGFSTYGEQFMGIHVNQTMTGLAIGYKQELQDD